MRHLHDLAVSITAWGARLRTCDAVGATRLADLATARRRTNIVLGHEHDGVPDEAFDLLDEVVRSR